MKKIEFATSRRYSKTFEGKLRAIHFKAHNRVELRKNGKLIVVYGSETLDGVTLVFADYPEGKFQLIGEGRGYVELMQKDDPDYFDAKLHQSLLQVD